MNRRNFLTIGAPHVRPTNQSGEVAFQKGGGTQNPPMFMRRSSTGLEPYAGPFEYKQAAHLLRRCMVGPTDAEIRQAVTDGLSATVTRLMQPFTPMLTGIDDWADQDPQIRAVDQAAYQAFQDEMFRKRETLLKWWERTIATSPVSIQERMTLFWHNHFTSELQAVNFSEWMFGQNQLLRKNMLGNFKQFTKDVTKDVAMLIYLDGIKNYKQGTRNGINENYARELQELFTMGVVDWDGNPNYTQTDVSEAARALSGWNFTASSKGTLYAGLTSQFISARWDSGSKTFLGKTGNWNADDIVDLIFSERGDAVAKYLCGKLYRSFVYDVQDQTVVGAMADTLKSGNWEIKPVMLQLLMSAHFFDETNIGALEKSPVDYLLGIIRGMGIKLDSIPDFVLGQTGRNSQDLRNRMQAQGMILFDPPNVKGWPGGRTWVSTSTLPTRQKFALDMTDGKLKVKTVAMYALDPVAFAKTFPSPSDIHALSTDMALFLLNITPSAKESEMLYNTLLDGGKDYEWSIDDPDQKAGERIKKFLKAVFVLAKHQLY